MNSMKLHNTMLLSNSTDNSTHLPAYSGFLLMGVSSFFLGRLKHSFENCYFLFSLIFKSKGSNFLPIKSFESGDGFFFQLVSTSILMMINCSKLYSYFES